MSQSRSKNLMTLFIDHFWKYSINRFLLVGILNTIFGYGVFGLLILLKLNYRLAILIATLVGVVFNFFTIGNIVFNKNKLSLIFKFLIVYTIVYFINITLMKYLLSGEVNIYLSQIICLPFIVIISYLLNKHFVFN